MVMALSPSPLPWPLPLLVSPLGREGPEASWEGGQQEGWVTGPRWELEAWGGRVRLQGQWQRLSLSTQRLEVSVP